MSEAEMIREEIDEDERYPDYIVQKLPKGESRYGQVRVIPKELYEAFHDAQIVYNRVSLQITEYLNRKEES